jgi:hypothetical protein
MRSRIIVIVCAFSVFFLLFFTGPIAAQSVKAFGVLAVPVGDFGDDSGNDAGMAKLGFGLGVDVLFPFDAPGLSWSLSSILMINPVDGDEMEDQMGGTIDVGSWMSIPLLTGIKYGGDVSSNVEMYVLGQAGLAFHRAPDIEWSGYIYDGYEYVPFTAEQNLDSSTSFAFCFGGGFLLNDRFDISLRYLGLGTPEMDGEVEAWAMDEYVREYIDVEQPVSIVVISAGIAF